MMFNFVISLVLYLGCVTVWVTSEIIENLDSFSAYTALDIILLL